MDGPSSWTGHVAGGSRASLRACPNKRPEGPFSCASRGRTNAIALNSPESATWSIIVSIAESNLPIIPACPAPGALIAACVLQPYRFGHCSGVIARTPAQTSALFVPAQHEKSSHGQQPPPPPVCLLDHVAQPCLFRPHQVYKLRTRTIVGRRSPDCLRKHHHHESPIRRKEYGTQADSERRYRGCMYLGTPQMA